MPQDLTQAALRMAVSMSRKGNCRDKASMESLNGAIKVECVYQTRFATRNQARRELVEYFGYYNTERMHSSLGYQTPARFEHGLLAQQRRNMPYFFMSVFQLVRKPRPRLNSNGLQHRTPIALHTSGTLRFWRFFFGADVSTVTTHRPSAAIP